jgi:hypothetical protein
MGLGSRPNTDYTGTWSPSSEIEYAALADGTRLRYLKAGSGPALILSTRSVPSSRPSDSDLRPSRLVAPART